MKPDEIYVPIDDTYKVSNYGNVKNSQTGRMLKLIWNYGYVVTLHNKKHLVHILVAKHFCKTSSGHSYTDNHHISHIDGNPKNNYYKNLEIRKKNKGTPEIGWTKFGIDKLY